jgi:multidrug efflux system outer membrane protein
MIVRRIPFVMKLNSLTLAMTAMVGLVSGCSTDSPFLVGPDYERPTNSVPVQYKAESLGAWKEGTPLDHVPKGAWWQVFEDPVLDELEHRATDANQDLRAAIARVDQARAVARVARSGLFPALDLNAWLRRERFSPNQEPSFGPVTTTTYAVPLDLSYEVDLWGRVRRSFESARAEADATLAELHNILLTLQADVAQNYFALRALDAEIASVRSTVDLRREQLDLVRSRFEGGIGNELDVARAETELATTETEAASLAQRRTELENALAILVGEHPSVFEIESTYVAGVGWEVEPPSVPAGLPA